MRTTHLAIAAAIVSALVVTGCGGGQPEVTKEALTKPADTSQFKGMMDQMKANVEAGKKR